MPTTLPRGEAEAWSVGELTARLKELLETALPAVWVRGEISNLRAQASGHTYFTLKDERAQLAAVLFRGAGARQRLALRDGLQVIAFGQIGVYEARGQYQLIVRSLVEDGVGRLQAEFERLKQRLAAEGLFAPENKVPLPAVPRTVGIITSPTGAAVQDFLRILHRREWRGRVVVLPAKVQGEGAAEEMVAMLELAQRIAEAGARTAEPGAGRAGPKRRVPKRAAVANELPLSFSSENLDTRPGPMPSDLRFDLLVIGRGGGSLEDLWAFNEEPLVRAVAACRLPIVSAVGHEIDFTLCDFAADVRAETPSAAAELISSGYLAAVERVRRQADELARGIDDGLAARADRLAGLRDRLRLLAPAARIEQSWLRLDDLSNRLAHSLFTAVSRRREAVAVLRGRFERAAPDTRIRFASQRLLGLWKRLQAASPASVLNRGFVILRDEAGQPIPRRSGLGAGRPVEAEFADGRARLRVD